VDFGFNNETAMVKVVEKDQDIYVQELIYSSGLTNSDLIAKILPFNIGGLKYIYCDSAEPQRIKEFRRANLNARPANKDVNKGIDTVKSRKLFVTKDSVNLIKELRSYRWKEKDGKPVDEPVKLNDHLVDALRYAVHSTNTQPFFGIK
jgi:phage terminase large subunit